MIVRNWISHANVVERHTIGDIMVWGAIASDFGSPLALIVGEALMAQLYMSDILCPHVLPLLRQDPGTVFQYDNASPYVFMD